MTRVVVISVLHRSGERLLDWAGALDRERRSIAETGSTLEAIAVDNASGDHSASLLRAKCPWISVLEQESNRGFAAACNLGLGLVAGEALVILLNPDVILVSGFVRALLEVPWPEDLGAIGPQVRGADGEIEQSARTFPTMRTGIFGRTSLASQLVPHSRLVRGQLLADPSAGARAVDWISGACMIVPTVQFQLVGVLDDGFWMYWEDADWCRRAQACGLRVEYHPELEVRHYQGSSSSIAPFRTTLAFHRSALRYYRLHVAGSIFTLYLAALLLSLRCAFKICLIGIRLPHLRWTPPSKVS